MKVYKLGIAAKIFSFLLILLSSYGIWSIKYIPPELQFPKPIVYIGLSLICLGFILFLIFQFLTEPYYYKIFYIPKKDFKISMYDNIHVWSYKGTAWIYGYNRYKKLEQKEVKAIQYYNTHRNTMYWKLCNDPKLVHKKESQLG